MNLKKIVRTALITETHKPSKRKYDYGCVMIGLNLNKADWNEIQDLIKEDDIYYGDGDNGGYGRELDPHITVLFGVHADVPDEDVEALIEGIKTPDMEMQKISIFENELFDVLKFDIESEDLHKLNKIFKELPHTSSYPDYHPHATICYLKKGKGKQYMEEMKDIEPLYPEASEVLYSKPTGPKKHYKL